MQSQFVERAVSFGEIPLRSDGLPFPLFFGADSEVNRYGHGDSIHPSTSLGTQVDAGGAPETASLLSPAPSGISTSS
jgi:hypothetical protein